MDTVESPILWPALGEASSPASTSADDSTAAAGESPGSAQKSPSLAKQHSARRPGPPSAAFAAATTPAQQQEGHSHSAASETQLADVWRHLKQLEKAVKSHMQAADVSPQHASAQSSGGIARGGSSILSAAAGLRADLSDASSSSSDDSTGTESPAKSARMSERQKLRDSLSKIKSEIADKAVKEVEAQLLQQRVACLEAALAGLTGSGLLAATGPGCTSCAGSFAGSILSLGRGSVCFRCQSQQQQPLMQQQAPRASTPTQLEPGETQL